VIRHDRVQLTISRELYEKLWGFDSHMFFWGVEDLDFGLKCWLLGHRILHDPEPTIAHRFRKEFDNYSVPIEHVVANQLRMARKNFTQSVWAEWLEHCRLRHPGPLSDHPEGLWARAWQVFEAQRASVEAERGLIQAHRVRDEFWYADRFGLEWPKLFTSSELAPQVEQQQQQPSPIPSGQPPCVESDEGHWYNGFVKGIPDLVGATATIDTRTPKLDCDPDGDFTDESDAWVGVTLTGGGDIDTWAQVGYSRERRKSGTTYTTKTYIYAE
jgi:hypothetical protein